MSPSSSFIRRPSCALLALEPVRAALEFAGHTVMREASMPKGDQHAVVVFPGLATNATVMRPLQSFCERLGYRCFDWGQGLNTGPKGEVDAWLDTLAQDVQARTADHAAPISLVGWSLGGIYAREVAKRLRPRVRQVITIGTPVAGAAKHTNVGLVYRLLNGSMPPDDPALLDRLHTAPPVPTTSIYSRSDGVVAWQACRDMKRGGRSESIEIEGSHCGMPWNPAVLKVLADRLAQPLHAWRPYASGRAHTQRPRASVAPC
ncbi:triacylglycerol lipase [Acidovorax sp. A1169]|uniref:esterase/lipase family protein n=1 Tax=Acidovorax sp. A1169 TaxID=3059524 RepID=UPI002737A264|nr:alpha/beta fold hydrolase [Acidovorax sp. A1169]MDP4077483.1 alpha/beta fold hydrolase [Acidovorax sp. A1169]